MPIPPFTAPDIQSYSMVGVMTGLRILFSDPSGTYNIPVPAGSLVTEVLTNVAEVCDGSPTLTVGDSTSAAGYLSSANIAPGTAGTAGTPAIKRSTTTGSGNAYGNGKRYATADNVTLTWVKGTSPTTGAIDVVVTFLPLTKLGIPAAVASTAGQ